ncbi:MAG: PhnA-like protein [Zymomonas sp.]|nr:MAG: PhnA-like protein [Zymomonas sp.]
MTDYTRPASETVGRAHTNMVASSAVDDAHTIMINKVSWGAIFAGVVVGLITQVLLTMLGVGIGIATLDPMTTDNPTASSFSIGAGIWYVLSGIIAAYVGGYIASRMSGKTVATTGALHGLTTWAFTTLLVLYMLSTAVGGIVGGAFSGVTSAIGGLGQTAATAAAPALAQANPLEALEQQVRSTGTDPESLNNAAIASMQALVMGNEGEKTDAREKAAAAIASAKNIPIEDARTQVQQYETQYNQTVAQAKATALSAADTAASVVSTGAILAFVALVLGAIAGWLGGRSGVVHPVYADRVMPSRRTI